jgi:hypothetical protein
MRWWSHMCLRMVPSSWGTISHFRGQAQTKELYSLDLFIS